jgi:type IV conjugative transfer system protein TraL
MDGDHDTYILSRLKDPWKFLMLDADIGVVAVAVGFLAMSMNAPTLVMVGAAAGVAYVMHKFREGRPKGWAAHWRYWYLPSRGLKRTPASSCHRTVG